MRRLAGSVLAAVLLLFTAEAWPQDTLRLSLEDCVELALKKNPSYLAATKQIDIAVAQEHEALGGFLPQLNLQGSYTWLEKVMTVEMPPLFRFPGMPAKPQRIKLDFTLDYQGQVTLTQPLFTSGRLWHAYKQARLAAKLAREKVRQTRQETILQVGKSYFGCLLADEFARVARQAVDVAAKHLKSVQDRRAVGMATDFDVLRAQVQLSNLEPQLAKAENGQRLAYLGLKELVGLDSNQPIALVDTFFYRRPDLSLDSAIRLALEKRPELRQMELQRQMGVQMLKLAKANDDPMLALQGNYSFRNDKFTLDRRQWDDFYTVNVVLSVPLFDGFRTHAKVSQARSQLTSIELAEEALRRGVRLQVQQAYSKFEEAEKRLNSQRSNVQQARESVRIAEASYQQGMLTNLEVISAQLALKQAETNWSQALYDCSVAAIEIQRAIGTLDSVKR